MRGSIKNYDLLSCASKQKDRAYIESSRAGPETVPCDIEIDDETPPLFALPAPWAAESPDDDDPDEDTMGRTKFANVGATAGRGGTGSGIPAAAWAAAIFFPCRMADDTTDWMAFLFVPTVCRRLLLFCAATADDTDATDDTPPRPSIVTSPSSPFWRAFASFWKYFWA